MLSKTQLLDVVWGFDHFDVNLVEVHIHALRQKLEKHGPRVIQTVRGVGYVLREPATATDEARHHGQLRQASGARRWRVSRSVGERSNG